jgi:hypothetical protein
MEIMTAAQEESLLSPLLATPESRRRWYRTFKMCSASFEQSPLPCFPQGPRYDIPTPNNKISPPSHSALLASEPLVADLKASIYRHSIDKFASRIRSITWRSWTSSRLKLYMATALDQDNDTWQRLLDVRVAIVAIFKRVLPTDFKYEELVSLLDTLSKDVHKVLNSVAVTQWPDAVKRKHAGCVFSHLTDYRPKRKRLSSRAIS